METRLSVWIWRHSEESSWTGALGGQKWDGAGFGSLLRFGHWQVEKWKVPCKVAGKPWVVITGGEQWVRAEHCWGTLIGTPHVSWARGLAVGDFESEGRLHSQVIRSCCGFVSRGITRWYKWVHHPLPPTLFSHRCHRCAHEHCWTPWVVFKASDPWPSQEGTPLFKRQADPFFLASQLFACLTSGLLLTTHLPRGDARWCRCSLRERWNINPWVMGKWLS